MGEATSGWPLTSRELLVNSPVLRRLSAAALTLAATLGVTLATTAAPAEAAGESYVALGDSYSAGNGTREKLDDCWRSSLAYPSLIAAQRGYALDFRACSGATVADVTSTQLGALSASTSFVTISIGGNDAGFADVLTECALPGWASDCDEAVDGAQSYIANNLSGSLSGLYGSIRSLAPNAEVVVVGYPRIFMGEDCNAITFFSPEEEQRLNETADQINAVIGSAASAAGFGFANPTSAFTGHAVCDDPEWINGFSDPIEDSYHPNAAGHASGYAPTVSGGPRLRVHGHAGRPRRGPGPGPGDRRLAAAARCGGPDHRARGLRGARPAQPRGAGRGQGARHRPGPLDPQPHLTPAVPGRVDRGLYKGRHDDATSGSGRRRTAHARPRRRCLHRRRGRGRRGGRGPGRAGRADRRWPPG